MDDDLARVLDERLRGDWATLPESDLSAPLLEFVREEGPALDAKVRALVLLSLVFTKASHLNELKPAILALLRACGDDAEEWVRVLADVVGKWLPDEFRVGDAALLESSVTAAAAKLQPFSSKLDALGGLPEDFCPLHWPFLSKQLMSKLQARSSFSAAAGSSSPAHAPAPSLAASAPAAPRAPPPPGKKPRKVVPLPDKLQEMMRDAPLLTPEDRTRIEEFFNDPKGATEVSYYLLSERHVTREDGVEGTEQSLVKLDPALRQWKPVKKFVRKKSSG